MSSIQRIPFSTRKITRQSCMRSRYSVRPCNRLTLALCDKGSSARSAIFFRINSPLSERSNARIADLEKRISMPEYNYKLCRKLGELSHADNSPKVTASVRAVRSEEHTSELQSLMRISSA